MSWYSREEIQEQREDFEAFQKESEKAFELANKQLEEERNIAPRYPWHSTESDFRK